MTSMSEAVAINQGRDHNGLNFVIVNAVDPSVQVIPSSVETL